MGKHGGDVPRPGVLPGRLPSLPALDGVRAVAVLAVLLYHGDVLWVPGGFLGVEVFFVLSGFLITSLLWGELRETGRISLRTFWFRRARRLLPALFAMLGVVTAVFLIGWPGDVARARGEIIGALTYLSNWYLIGADHSYFSSLGRPSPFGHLWSLAIEEQFYLVWPAVLAALAATIGRARRIAGLVVRAAAVSAVLMFLIHSAGDPSRAYYGTDTRAAGLLLGAALGLVWRPWETGTAGRHLTPRALDAITVGAGAFLVWAFMRYDGQTAFTFRPGIHLVALATAALIAAAVHPRARLGRLLGVAPLRALGRRSYAIYLWHWPVFVVTRPGADLDLGVGSALAIRLAITLALAELSYRYVEEPIRNGGPVRVWERARAAWGTPRLALRAATAGVALVSGMTVLTAAVARAPIPATSAVERSLAPVVEPSIPASPVAVEARREIPPRRVPARVVRPVAVSKRAGPSLVEPVFRLPSFDADVVLIGDSVMLGARQMLPNKLGPAHVDAAVSRQVSDGIEVLRRLRDRGRLGEALVIHLGNNGPFSRDQFETIMKVAEQVPTVVFVSVKVPRRWESAVNATIAWGVERYANATLVDWHARWRTCGGDVFASDGIHLTGTGARCYAALIATAL